jgi:hypothetical protein
VNPNHGLGLGLLQYQATGAVAVLVIRLTNLGARLGSFSVCLGPSTSIGGRPAYVRFIESISCRSLRIDLGARSLV